MPTPLPNPSGPRSATVAGWLMPKGELGQAIAAFPWPATPWGALETWPPHLRSIVNLMLQSAAPMAIIWGRDYRFLYNDRYAELIQDKHPAALGATCIEVFPELWPLLKPLFERTIGGEALLNEDQELQLTRGGVTKPGYFSFSYTPVPGETGTIDGFFAVVIETTVRVARERERAQVFDTVLSAITDFAYTFDREGRFIYANKALLDLLGFTQDQVVGKTFFELPYPKDLAERLQRQIETVVAEKKAVRDETRYLSPTGVEGYFEYIFSPMVGPDGDVRVVAGITRDITARKKLELEAIAASQAKDDFLATLSHELRTPLNPVLLLASDAAQNRDWPAEVRADFQTIADNINLEARLIDDLLDISRITHDKLPLTFAVLDLNAVLAKAIAGLHGDLAAKALVVSTEFGAAPAIMTADEVRLHQIFSNLLRNAVKFTGPGGRITVSTRLHPSRRQTVMIEVADTGIGLTPNEIANIFRPFVQGEYLDHGQTSFGGLGLGLTIARKLAELHSGTITASSPGRDQGATFTVELPLGARQREAAAPAAPPAVPAPVHRVLRIMLVEDHEVSRQALARLLTARKFEVVQAASAEEALTKASLQRVDLVISDLGLPDMDGYRLMSALRQAYGYEGIALSGYGAERDIVQGKEAGFVVHLTKPVQSQVLFDAIYRLAGEKK
jgi:PAS domain S-box-containing protein